jgi:hypothetical protein
MIGLNKVSFYLQGFEEIFMGLPLFLAPDFYFNAEDGLIVFRPFRHTSLDSDHMDTMTQISLAGAGATMLTLLSCRLWLAESTAQLALISRMKLLSDLMLLPVIINTTFFEYNDFVDRKTFMLLANFKVLLITLNYFTMKLHRSESQEQGVTNGQSMGAQVIMWYALPMALLLYIFPGCLAPGAFSYYLKTPLADNTFDPVEKFAIRFEGSQIVGFLPLFWNAAKNPAFAYKTGLVFMTLYVNVFLRGVMDKTGSCNLNIWKGNFVLHLLVISLAWNFKKTRLESFAPLKTFPHIGEFESKSDEDTLPPNLKSEELHLHDD